MQSGSGHVPVKCKDFDSGVWDIMAEATETGGGMSLTTKIMLGMLGGLITGTVLNMLGSASLNG